MTRELERFYKDIAYVFLFITIASSVANGFLFGLRWDYFFTVTLTINSLMAVVFIIKNKPRSKILGKQRKERKVNYVEK